MITRQLLLFVTLVAPLLIGAGTPSQSTPRAPSTPKHVKYYNQGVEAQKQKDYDRAIELYEKALKIQPDFPDALNNLGFSLRSIAMQYMDEAMRAYEKALKLQNNHAEALEYQGELYLWRGEPLKAYQNYLRLSNMNSREAAELKRHLDRVVAQARKIR
ncbi:MAG: tetratricopeptide repeat protein [Acidiferrobacterales bacterium]